MIRLLFGLGLVLGGCATSPSVDPPPGPSVAETGLVSVDATQVPDLVQSPDGRLVLVNVWATWCAPCIAEFPDLVRIQQDFAGRVDVRFISTDVPSQRAAAERFFQESGASAGYLKAGPDEPFINALHPEWSGSLPMTVVFDGSGQALGFWEQPLGYTTLRNALLIWLEDAN